MADAFARMLRRNATETEKKLWWLLRRKQQGGFRFRRQAPLGPYYADFFCASARLVVELDGAPHTTTEQIAHDEKRTRWLTAHGIRVVRFTNREVYEDAERVADAIYLAAAEQVSAAPLPSRG